MISTPLVSCLCVTRNRTHLLDRAIECFRAQTYPNKELIIVSDDDDLATRNYVEGIDQTQIRHVIVEANPNKRLGELRNIAIENSSGEYFCQWDDDDWYHVERLSRQVYAAIENYHPGSVLTNWIIFDEVFKQAYFSRIRWWEGSILFRKDVVTEKNIRYPDAAKSEDTVFVQEIVNKSRIYPLVTHPIYIYTYHGTNTWDRAMFEQHFKLSQKLSQKLSSTVQKILEREYSPAEASKLLFSADTLEEINYFHALKTEDASITGVYQK